MRRLELPRLPLVVAGLGLRLVLVLGARPQINEVLRGHGAEPRYEAGYRVTDEIAMEAAIQAAGLARMEVEARLSKVRCSPSVQHKQPQFAHAAPAARPEARVLEVVAGGRRRGPEVKNLSTKILKKPLHWKP
jgi:acetylglutamate kinase